MTAPHSRLHVAFVGLAITAAVILLLLPNLGAGAASGRSDAETARAQHGELAVTDGTRSLAYTVSEDGSLEIVALKNDQATNLSRSPSDDFSPAWSPDGTRLAFVSNRGGDYDIYAMDADGGNVSRLTYTPGLDTNPSWSPDGKEIAYVHETSLSLEIFAVEVDGGTPRQLTDNKVVDIQPDWSPEGALIAFTRNIEGDKWGIVTMTPTGEDISVIVKGEMYASSPAWSPDGSRLAYLADPGQTDEPSVHVLTPATGDDITLTIGPGLASLAWTPGGDGLVYLEKSDANKYWQKSDPKPTAGLWRLMLVTTDGDSQTLVEPAQLQPGISW